MSRFPRKSGGDISDDGRKVTVMKPLNFERDLSGDVNVKQMNFAVESHQLPCHRVNDIDRTRRVHTDPGVNTR